MISTERVGGGDAAHWAIEVVEQFVGDAGGDFRAITPGTRVFVSHDHAIGFLYGGGDRFPVVGAQRTQIQNFRGDAVAGQFRGSDFGAMHDRAVSDDADVGAFTHHAGFAERDGEVRAGIFGTIVRLAVEMFMFEEQDRIIRTNGRAQQAAHIECGRRHDYAQARNVGENHFAALAMIDSPAGKISADGDPHHDRRLEITSGAPANGGQFVAQLHHGRPDVIEELNFGDWFQSAGGHADRASDNIRLRQRRIEDAVRAEFALQAGRGFEDAALPFHRGELFFAAAIGDVFTEDDDARVALHFVDQRGRDHFDHGFGIAVLFGFGVELL